MPKHNKILAEIKLIRGVTMVIDEIILYATAMKCSLWDVRSNPLYDEWTWLISSRVHRHKRWRLSRKRWSLWRQNSRQISLLASESMLEVLDGTSYRHGMPIPSQLFRVTYRTRWFSKHVLAVICLYADVCRMEKRLSCGLVVFYTGR